MDRSATFVLLVLTTLCLQGHSKPNQGKPKYSHDDRYHSEMQDGVSTNGDFIGSGRIFDWHELGQQEIERALDIMRSQRETPAKNVIFFLGDGMGISTVTAARVFHAQSRQLEGDDAFLAWDKLDHVGLSMTYNTDRFVADSAGTATAFLCGEKARTGVVCVNQEVVRDNCSTQTGNELKSVIHKAMEAGKASGVVTTTRITHATPSVAYAHAANRNWEVTAPDGCRDIAMQLVEDEFNQDVNVFMGGGRRMFLPNTTADLEDPDVYGSRVDGRNLLEEWEANMRAKGFDEDEAMFIMDQAGFDNIDVEKVERVLALFNADNMEYEIDRADDTFGEPSLAEMTEKAIQILSKDEDGFILLVEGGRIDMGHHANNAFRALHDTVALSDAVSVAKEMVDLEDTLIMVTADHSHVLTISGSPGISQSILGYDEDHQMAEDGKPFQTLSYANGPGYYVHRTSNGTVEGEQSRLDLSTVDSELFEHPDWLQDAGVPLGSEKHGGEEVAIYASGPMSQLIHGTHQQSYIAHVMLYAMCIEGPDDMPHCEESNQERGNSESIHQSLFTVLSLLVPATLVSLFLRPQ